MGEILPGLVRKRRVPSGRMLSPSVENLVAQLTRLPGIGSRTAQRLAFHLLQTEKEEALALAGAIEEVKERVRFCRECGNLTEEELCSICVDTRRDRTTICVVEQPVDLVSLERTAEYRGLYHVLGGSLSPLDGVEPEHLRIDELIQRVQANGVVELERQRARRLDADAFVGLLERHDVSHRRLAFRLLGSGERMDDVLQEAYVRAFRALPGFRGDSSLETWLYRIVYNACVDDLR